MFDIQHSSIKIQKQTGDFSRMYFILKKDWFNVNQMREKSVRGRYTLRMWSASP